MKTFVKLFGSILHSTIWDAPMPTKITWITMLAMADCDGEVMASIPGLAKAAGVSLEQCKESLVYFLGPDEYSRTKDNDGRRIEEIDGGWRLLNHGKYREMMSKEDRNEKQAKRQQRYQDRKNRQQPSATVRSDASDDIQIQIQSHKQIQEETPKPPRGVYPVEFEKFWESTWRMGTKGTAYKAWCKDRPSAESCAEPIRTYLAAKKESGQFLQQVSVWLNGGGHRQTEWRFARITKDQPKPIPPSRYQDL